MSISLPQDIQRVVVVGAGRSGVAAARVVRREGRDVVLVDGKPREALDPALLASVEGYGIVLRLGDRTEVSLEGVDLVVKSPGVPGEASIVGAARSLHIPVWSEVELAYRLLPNPIVGVTGTNGKTTTTALIGHMFEAAGRRVQVLGNIGTPVVSIVGDVGPDEELVLELSSFQLEDVREFRPTVGVLLNVTQDHLDRHKRMERYVACKGRLFFRQGPGDTAVLNASDPYAAATGRELEQKAEGPQVSYFSVRDARGADSWLEGDRLYLYGRPALAVEEISLRGPHNMENCLAAATAGLARGLPWEAVLEALRTFPGVAHRLESAGFMDGVEYVNDSKATNVEAALKGLAAFPGGVHLILGGRDKGSDYRPIARACASECRGVYLIGEAASVIADTFAEVAREQTEGRDERPEDEGRPQVVDCGDLETAVREAGERARPGEIVLLAPACASFDQYESFEERGLHFRRLVAQHNSKRGKTGR